MSHLKMLSELPDVKSIEYIFFCATSVLTFFVGYTKIKV